MVKLKVDRQTALAHPTHPVHAFVSMHERNGGYLKAQAGVHPQFHRFG
jgi:hypothetical protein